jgi:RNA polymerase sigma-70 factor (ECF subfamily)
MHGDSVYKFCRNLTYSKEDAEDLFQETFIKTFEQLAKLNASNNPKSFLFSTALYLWKSWKRKYARRNHLAPVEPLGDEVLDVDSMEDSIMAQEDIRIVRAIVDSLPEKFKIPIILYYTIQMSIPEISTTLKFPEGTVKSRLHKARKLIEKGLVENGYER